MRETTGKATGSTPSRRTPGRAGPAVQAVFGTEFGRQRLAGEERRGSRRPVRLDEGVLKTVSPPEILDGIAVGLPKLARLDQVEDDVADVLAGTDPPVVQHRHHHRAVLFQRVLPQAVEQLRARDVAFRRAACAAAASGDAWWCTPGHRARRGRRPARNGCPRRRWHRRWPKNGRCSWLVLTRRGSGPGSNEACREPGRSARRRASRSARDSRRASRQCLTAAPSRTAERTAATRRRSRNERENMSFLERTPWPARSSSADEYCPR